MTLRNKLALLVVTSLGLAACAPVAADSQQPPAATAQLHWLAGCWQADNGEDGSIEQWMPPAGGMMLGMSRVLRNGQAVAFEYLRIAESADSGLILTASPSGQATTAFALLEIGPNRVVFENPQHDFPQRVGYVREGDRLLGRISGMTPEGERHIDFPMHRRRCEQ